MQPLAVVRRNNILGQVEWRFEEDDVDWAALSELYRVAPLGEKRPEDLKVAFTNSRFKCFAYHEHEVIGVGRALADGVDCSYICDVAVHPNYQGLGIGKIIVTKLRDFSHGHRKVILYSVPGKEGFYKKLGFSRMSTAMAIFKEPRPALQMSELQEDFAQVSAWISEYFDKSSDYRVLPDTRPGDVIAQLPEEAPELPESFGEILSDFKRIIIPATTHWNHPRFFAYFATSSSPAAIAAEALSATLDVKAMLWRTSPAATELEQVTMRWLGQLLGVPTTWTGIIYDTASTAGFTAIAAARESLNLAIREKGSTARDLPRLRLYVTEHTHSHIEKAAIALGIGQENLVKVPTDSTYRMRADSLDACILRDLSAGMLPVAIVATVGTTSTTSIDPVPAVAKIARKHGVWLHIDAAYAGMAAMVPEYRHLLEGVEHADSLVVNPHKWMFLPMDLSVLFVKEATTIKRAFSLVPEYLASSEGDVVNYMDYGLQLGRRFRSLKLWFVLRTLGAEGVRNKLRAHIDLAQQFASWVRNEPEWDILAPHPLSVVCFRYHPQGVDSEAVLEDVNARILKAINDVGDIFISHTKIDEKYALRIAIGNFRTELSDVECAWHTMRNQAQRVIGMSAP